MELMQITSQLYQKFDKYPVPLREQVEEQYTDTIYHLLSTTHPTQPATYHIISGASTSGTSPADYKTAQDAVFPNASLANVAVLEQFLPYTPARKALFVKAPGVRLANPEFAALHSVPSRMMGWGFDVDGCLSLHLTRVEGNRLKHLFVYVVKKGVVGVKGEDEECVIVEDREVGKK